MRHKPKTHYSMREERRGGKNVFRSRERKIIHNSCVCAESRGENYHLLSKILIN